MKTLCTRFALVLLSACCLLPSAQAASYYRAIFTITNVPPVRGALSGDSELRQVTNSTPASAGKFWQYTNTMQAVTTNLWQHLLNYPFTNQLTVKLGTNDLGSPTNTIVVELQPDRFVSFSSLSNWVTITYGTNTSSAWIAVRVPVSNEVTSVQTQIVSGLIHTLNAPQNTNSVDANAPAFTNRFLMQNAQSVTYTNKNFTGGTNAPAHVTITHGTIAGTPHTNAPWLMSTNLRSYSARLDVAMIDALQTTNPVAWGNFYIGDTVSGLFNAWALQTDTNASGHHVFQLYNEELLGSVFSVTEATSELTTRINSNPATDRTYNYGSFYATSLDTLSITGTVATFGTANIGAGNTTNTTVSATLGLFATAQALAGYFSNGVFHGTAYFTGGFASNLTFSAVAGAIGTAWITNGIFTTSLLGTNATFHTLTATQVNLSATALNGTNRNAGTLINIAASVTTLASGNNILDRGTAEVLRLSGSTTANLNAITNGFGAHDAFWIINDSGGTLTVLMESGFTSIPNNRIRGLNGATSTVSIVPGGAGWLVYNSGSSYWELKYPQSTLGDITASTVTLTGTTNSLNFASTNVAGSLIDGPYVSVTVAGDTNVFFLELKRK